MTCTVDGLRIVVESLFYVGYFHELMFQEPLEFLALLVKRFLFSLVPDHWQIEVFWFVDGIVRESPSLPLVALANQRNLSMFENSLEVVEVVAITFVCVVIFHVLQIFQLEQLVFFGTHPVLASFNSFVVTVVPFYSRLAATSCLVDFDWAMAALGDTVYIFSELYDDELVFILDLVGITFAFITHVHECDLVSQLALV